jgi:4,4'-diaponeurosporenoate glycosyltransferase
MRTTDLATFVLGWLAGWWMLARIARPRTARPSGRLPCTVVVPARNEVRTLPTLLASLEPQLQPGDEVLVVDDHSEDGTATVPRGPATQVLPAPPLPDGWTGKCWACWTGAQHGTAPVLLFLDADTQLEPGGLDRMLGEQHRHRGLISVQPFHAVRRPYEHLSCFFNVVSMMGVDAFTPLGSRRPPRGAFGPALAVGRDEYFELGGHAAVRGEVLDDMALAASWTEAERPLTVMAGRGTIRFRMYPDGVGHLLEGWSKNLAGGAARTRLVTLLLIVLWVAACLSAPWWVVRAGLPPSSADAGELAVGVAAYLLVVAQLWWAVRRIGSFGLRTAALYPVPLAFFLLVFCRSTVLTAVRGRVSWKGREIVTRRRPAA